MHSSRIIVGWKKRFDISAITNAFLLISKVRSIDAATTSAPYRQRNWLNAKSSFILCCRRILGPLKAHDRRTSVSRF